MLRNLFVHDSEWQYPAITEQHAFHRVRDHLPDLDGRGYLAFPWATLFDLLNKSHPRAGALLSKLQGLASEVRDAGPAIVASVCQHVDLPKHAAVVAEAGVTDVFWSHTTKAKRFLPEAGGLRLHPFPLYPVNVVREVSPQGEKPLLFSFAGAIENPCYLSKARVWIRKHLQDHPEGSVVERMGWHYHGEVYEAQIHGRAPSDPKGQKNKGKEFCQLMGESIFSLCPSGSGPNSIRLWESIASGVIPVILSDGYLPPGSKEDWENAVVFCLESEEEIRRLPERLAEIASDPTRVAEMHLALRKLSVKYGPNDFVSDIKAFFLQEFLDSVHIRSRLAAAFKSYRSREYSNALECFSGLDSAPLNGGIRRSVEFFKSACKSHLEKNPAGSRILFVIPSPRSGATGRYTQVLAEELVRLGAAVMVLADGAAPGVENGVPWEPIEFEGAFLSTALRRRISLFRPNIVYENGVRSRAQRAALEAVYLTGARFAMQSEDDDVQIHNFRHGEKAVDSLTSLDKTPVQPSEIAKFLGNLDWGHSLKVLKNPAHDRWVEPLLRVVCYHLAEAHTAIWHPFAKRLEAQYGKPTLVVPPVCGEEYFSLEPLQESQRAEILGGFQIPADRTVFFVAGAIYPYSEEFRAFISAMNLAAEHSSCQLCLVVSGRGWKEAPRMAQEELSTKILFRNLEEPDDARYLEMLRAADVTCTPGVCDEFTRYRLPSRLVKAMAMGKPILMANWGFGESLRNGVDAFLTEGNNPALWVQTILNAMDARKREEVGRWGKKFAEKNFRAGPVSGELLTLFQGIVRGSSPAELADRSRMALKLTH
jgi:glycosyltransferase involved in cell wall biosynthesis